MLIAMLVALAALVLGGCGDATVTVLGGSATSRHDATGRDGDRDEASADRDAESRPLRRHLGR